jgi:phenylacetate-CoA ligase
MKKENRLKKLAWLAKLDRLVGSLAYTLWDTKEGGTRLEEFNKLKKFDRLPPSQTSEIQTQKLDKLIKHAGKTTEWYKKIVDSQKINTERLITIDDLALFPVTTKLDIRENTDQFLSSLYTRESLNKTKTGGSTGVSLNLFFDEPCQRLRNAAQMYADNLAGWNIGDRVAAVWGNPPVATSLKEKLRSYLLERTIYLDTMNLNPTSMMAFVKLWQEFLPEVIFGHSHSIYILAQFLLKNNIQSLRPAGIVATSMMLVEHERTTIEEAFNCKVTNRYGCEEVGLIAVECEQHNGMHINSAHVIVECLDGNDQPVKFGEPGKLVITDLNNYAMPLIRYRVEDVGILSERQCSCGRTSPLLEKLEGRVADFLKKADGGQVAGVSLVERTLTKIPGIEQMQLVQEHLHKIVINRVKGSEYNEQTDQLLLEEFRLVFDADVTITINDVISIAQEKSGKYRFSICKI